MSVTIQFGIQPASE